MNVEIVAFTQWNPKFLKKRNIKKETDIVAYTARVSNPSNQANALTANKLLKYLATNKHWSPFEMVDIIAEIETTRDIARQILRHRSFTFQEFSQRYADPTVELDFETREARLQDTKNRQNSLEVDDVRLLKEWEEWQQKVIKQSLESYQWAIKNGIAKEQARVVLPEGNTKSRLYMKGSLRSWMHYCALRMANGTQKEHAIIAKEIWRKLTKLYPSLSDVI